MGGKEKLRWETWNTWYEKGIMSYGWGERIGDFSQYDSEKEIQNALKKYNEEYPKAKQGTTTYERVAKEI